MKRVIFFLLTLGAILLTACGSGLDEKEARQVATQAALGTPPPPKYQTAAAIYLGLTLTPTPTRIPYGTPTMSIEQMGATMMANQQNIAATQNAQQVALEQQRLAAEQQAERAKATQEAAVATSRAVDAIRTANAQATSQQATANALATGTQQGLIFIQQTQAANAQSTQVSGRETQMAQPTHFAWTVTAVYIENRIKEGQARDVELAVRRQEMKNGFDAYGTWLLVIFIVIVTSEGFKKWLKVRVFHRDEAGKMPVVSMEKEGKTALLKLEQITTAGVTVDNTGKIEEMEPTDREEQKNVTRRAQAIEAISQVPTPYARQGTKMMNDEFGVRKSEAPTIRFNDRAMSVVVDEADSMLMEEA